MIHQYPHLISLGDVLSHLGAPFVFLIVIGIGLLALRLWLAPSRALSSDVTMQRRALLTQGEQVFLAVLEAAVAGQSRVFAQVPLAALIKVQAGDGKAWKAATNRIDRKRVDFVLVDPKSFEVQAVVELDDSSHLSDDRSARDEIVDDALGRAGIPIVHYKAQATYKADQLLAAITNARAGKGALP